MDAADDRGGSERDQRKEDTPRMMLPRRCFQAALAGLLALQTVASFIPAPTARAQDEPPSATEAPVVDTAQAAAGDWPQLGQNAQRTNASSQQVNGPYCYAWKWYGIPFASRAQPVVAAGRLFLGGMDGVLYARDASTGGALWQYQTGGPIRHSAGVAAGIVVVGSHDGSTYGIDATNGGLVWRTTTGPSATAPLIDEARGWAYVGSTDGTLTALNASTGAVQWAYPTGAAILTSPALSADGNLVYVGNENIQAIAVNAQSGTQAWRTTLRGQSLTDRYPVVLGDTVVFRSQPVYNFHKLLLDGDGVMDRAGGVRSSIEADWAVVRPQIVSYLNAEPDTQTFFALNAASGASRGTAPVLYTYGNNDTPAPPVQGPDGVYTVYRPRRGMQTDGGSTHVRTKYDAEIGRINLSSLDITGVRQAGYPTFGRQLRATSDEPAVLTFSGNIMLVDNWERLGGLNVSTGQLLYASNVSNEWPECYDPTGVCGPYGTTPFFPMSGSGAAYPFPSPRVTEGNQRPGAVVANNMIYWRVIEGGLGALKTGPCGAAAVYTSEASTVLDDPATAEAAGYSVAVTEPEPVQAVGDHMVYLPALSLSHITATQYFVADLTLPDPTPPMDLVLRVRAEVSAMLTRANGQHLMPYYLERGFSNPNAWPHNARNCPQGQHCLPVISFVDSGLYGNVFWQDPGELLYTMAMAYPYLGNDLQAQARAYMAAEMARFSPLSDLPYGGTGTQDWLKVGVARENYAVPFRSRLNNWPPVAANFSALYGLWLWSRNTADYNYACTRWSSARSLYNARRTSLMYYADLAGAIGYARLAQDLRTRGCAAVSAGDVSDSENTAITLMQSAVGSSTFNTFRARADSEYLDPRNIATGWSAPVFFGLTPEVGALLRDQTSGAARDYLLAQQSGNGMRWWYLTRAGVQSEEGETSFILPSASWSFFMARAYVLSDNETALRRYLDRPLAVGDLYSIQRLVATIQAPD